MKFYKIRKKGTTDVFSSGGSQPRWTKRGKSWSSIGHVRQHLGNASCGRYLDSANYADAEIVEYEVVVGRVWGVADEMRGVAERIAQKEQKRQVAAQKERERQERQEMKILKTKLEALQNKYPNG